MVQHVRLVFGQTPSSPSPPSPHRHSLLLPSPPSSPPSSPPPPTTPHHTTQHNTTQHNTTMMPTHAFLRTFGVTSHRENRSFTAPSRLACYCWEFSPSGWDFFISLLRCWERCLVLSSSLCCILKRRASRMILVPTELGWDGAMGTLWLVSSC